MVDPNTLNALAMSRACMAVTAMQLAGVDPRIMPAAQLALPFCAETEHPEMLKRTAEMIMLIFNAADYFRDHARKT